MVKTAVERKRSITDFVAAIGQKIVVRKVFLWGAYAERKASENSEVRLMVIAPSFEGTPEAERVTVLGPMSARVDTLIQAWRYNSDELEGTKPMPPLQGMALPDSKLVFPASDQKSKRASKAPRREE